MKFIVEPNRVIKDASACFCPCDCGNKCLCVVPLCLLCSKNTPWPGN